MIPTDLFFLNPGTLPGGDEYCFLGWQRLYVDMFTRAQILMRNEVGVTFWNISASTPPADRRIYPWLNLNDGRVYQWSFTYGKWISPRAFSFGQWWLPLSGQTESDLWSMDGGDGSDPRALLPNGSANPAYVPPTPVTGAMWQVEHALDGRFPLGAGTIPGTTPPVTVSAGDTLDSDGVSGSYDHTLLQSEGGLGAHDHFFGIANPAGDDAYFARVGSQTVPAYTGFYITGSGPQTITPETTADLKTLPPLDATGAIATPDPFVMMPPYKALFFVTPTTRSWYALPG